MTSRMLAEAGEAPVAVTRMLARNADAVGALARRWHARPPRLVTTIARGSSDNAATYARYLLETRLGVVTASTPPSVSAVFGARPAMGHTLALALSQSGRSPDLLQAARTAVDGGAELVAMVNDETSPLAVLADTMLPLSVGAERSVAATKSFLATLASAAQLAAAWGQDRALQEGLASLPDRLAEAWELDWSAAVPVLAAADHLLVIGRGPGLAVALEAALKFKETSGLHAEAFSAAEVRHGPMALAGARFPVLAFLPADEARAGVEETVARFRAVGATVLTVGGHGPHALPVVPCHPALLPIVQAQAFYRLADRVAAERGHDPDAPPLLAKVTETL
jgi:glucosamine--fructose-6-phosphate aminotransferase (isomerizing)